MLRTTGSTMMLNWSRSFLTLVVLVATSGSMLVDACTVFAVGKKASVDGSTMVSHSNDGEFDTDPRLVKIPAADYSQQPNAKRPVYYSPENYPRYVGTARGEIPEYYPKSEDDEPFEAIGYIPQVIAPSHTWKRRTVQ